MPQQRASRDGCKHPKRKVGEKFFQLTGINSVTIVEIVAQITKLIIFQSRLFLLTENPF